jgi:ribonuclease HII
MLNMVFSADFTSKSSNPMPDLHYESLYPGMVVAGIDEVGRGPLAGPVLAAAAIIPPDIMLTHPELAARINDSKALSAKARIAIYQALRPAGVILSFGAASVTMIDRVNIRQATFLAMLRAVNGLKQKPQMLLIDGNDAPAFDIPSLPLVGGDARCLSIAAASIAAKVLRDQIMARLDARYPAYGWVCNSGYGTKSHTAALVTYGLSKHHRRSFCKKLLRITT